MFTFSMLSKQFSLDNLTLTDCRNFQMCIQLCCVGCFWIASVISFEPPPGKTNNVVSEQV